MAIEIVVQPSLPNVVVSNNPSFVSPDLSNYATLLNLNNTSGVLSNQIETSGYYLYNLINTSAAGVSSLNGASGILSIIGTGNIFITTSGQVIRISGEGGSSQSVNLSGFISTGQADVRYYPLYNNPSGYLNTLSGLSIQYILDVSGALSLRLISTGSILDAKINSFSGYINSNFSTINYVNFISGQLANQIQQGGGSGITSLNSLDGSVNLISSLDSFSFNNTGNNININQKPQNTTIYRNISGQITGVQKNIEFISIFRNINNKITGVYSNNYYKKILLDNEDNITGVNVVYV